jgi:hypothetical protein
LKKLILEENGKDNDPCNSPFNDDKEHMKKGYLSPSSKLEQIQKKFDWSNIFGTTVEAAWEKVRWDTRKKILSTFSKGGLNETKNKPLLETHIKPYWEGLLYVLDKNTKQFVVKNVSMGISPSYEINARCIALSYPYYGYLIILNWGIMHLVYELIKIGLASFFDRIRIEVFKKKTKMLLDNFINEEKLEYMDFPLESREEIQLLDYLIRSAEFMIVCHEFSHIEKGHMDNASAKRDLLWGEQLTVLNYTQNQEKEADIGAMDMIFMRNLFESRQEVSPDILLPLFAPGPIVLFSIFDLFEKHQQYVSETHPSGSIRKKYVTDFLRKNCNVPDFSYELAQYFESLFSQIPKE